MLGWLRIIAAIAGVVVIGATTALAQTRADPAKKIERTPRAEMDMLRALPLAFYVAKGPPNSCGPGCDTWIAADGGFDLGAANRFRRFIKTQGRSSLPIFFNSPGGVTDNAMSIGRMMREFHMTAGVAKTIPRECSEAKLSEKACHTLKSSGRDLAAELAQSNSACASACVYALVGASRRNIAPGSVLGIHAGLPIAIYSDGRVGLGTTAGSQSLKARLRTYITFMGVDPALLDAAESTSHDQIHVLARDEIVRFRIDPREASETWWTLQTPSSGAAYLSKTVLKAKATGSAVYLQRTLVISCAPSPANLILMYAWLPDVKNPEAIGLIRVGMGGLPVWLPPNQTRSVGRNQVRVNLLSVERFKEAAELYAFYVQEGSEPDRPVLSFSTAGLTDALSELTKRCPKP